LQQFISIILDSGRAGLDMALYILLPIMVVMLAFMKLLEAKGILAWISNRLAPVSHFFGIPGLGIFAMIKILFVSFAAPIPTLVLMDTGRTTRRHIAATLAMVMTMAQANASFPLTAVGLNLGVSLITSLLAGLCAAAFTYYVECALEETIPEVKKKSVMQILSDGGQEGLKIVINMIPVLILALFLVNVLKATGSITLLTAALAPALELIGLPEITVLPIVTKFIAGGTAFTGVTIDLMNQGLITPQELNRMAGFTLNPFDIAGVALFASIGKRVGGVIRYSVYGAFFGLFLKGLMHCVIF
jgi:spore maturation protein SpmB